MLRRLTNGFVLFRIKLRNRDVSEVFVPEIRTDRSITEKVEQIFANDRRLTSSNGSETFVTR